MNLLVTIGRQEEVVISSSIVTLKREQCFFRKDLTLLPVSKLYSKLPF